MVAAGEVVRGARARSRSASPVPRARRAAGRALVRDDHPDRRRPSAARGRGPAARPASGPRTATGLAWRRGERLGDGGEVLEPRAPRAYARPSAEAPRPRRSIARTRARGGEHAARATRHVGGRSRCRGRGAAAGPRDPAGTAIGRTPRSARRPATRRRPWRVGSNGRRPSAASVPPVGADRRQAPGEPDHEPRARPPARAVPRGSTPPWRSAIQRAIARPRPVPPAGASGARQNRSNTCSRCVGVDARPLVLDGQPRPGPDRDRHPAARRRVADRVVDEDRRPAGAAAPRRRGRARARRPAPAARRAPRPRAPATRPPRPRRARGPCRSPRARRRRRRSARAAAGRRRATPSGWPPRRGRRAPGPPSAGSARPRRSSAIAARVIVSGVRSSWLASAANSRWRRSDSRIGTSARPAYT